ncbi:MAG: hypothetical protein HWE13_02615 [Gammaproteobacteria bacterium]|nr:hypothetical protein [Gammaproteobacteria bacterium]NVK86987.1 hypothetical protein [Gammaproteobacteria bacterium]
MSLLVDLHHYRSAQNTPCSVYLTELTAAVELTVDGIDTHAVVRMLDNIIRTTDNQPFAASDLTASDRDWLLAHLYQKYWSNRIVSTLECDQCAAPFDLSFELSALVSSIYQSIPREKISGNARFMLAQHDVDDVIGAEEQTDYANDHSRLALNLPTFAHEQATVSVSLQQARNFLLQATRDDGESHNLAPESLALLLEKVAPIVDLELEAACPECSKIHWAHFDLQSYCMKKIIGEKDNLLVEIHLIASHYGWSLAEIEQLPRTVRQSMANLIVASR